MFARSGSFGLTGAGLDVLPAEFYLRFWSVLGQDLVQVLNSCYRAGSLTLSQCCGVISLSFKKGDCLDMRNWHPISLLNIDYKLAAHTVAARLLKVIYLIVAKDQTLGSLAGTSGRMLLSFVIWFFMPLPSILRL